MNMFIPGYGLNRGGQIRVNYTGLAVTGFEVDVAKDFPLETATPSVHAWPTTVWESNNVTHAYDPDFFDHTTHRLRENAEVGQSTLWRVNGTYAGKNLNNNGALDIQLYNPDSGFSTSQVITLPSGRTSGPFTTFMLTIADNASLAAGRGYKLRVITSFLDAGMVVNISNIVRSSRSIENYSHVLPE